MGVYRTAEVCPNGHTSTSSVDQNPELSEKFCSECGEATITACPSCGSAIRGDYDVEGVVSIGFSYEPPAFCHGCGQSFPWTSRKLDAAVELVEIDGSLSAEELADFRSELGYLVKDSPRTQVASVKFNGVMSKVGASIAGGVKEIVVGVLSEAAKKAIWGV